MLAIGLAMDATAVATARGLARRWPSDALVLPLLFGAFQAGMAAVGWLAGRQGGALFARWDHWIAFALLAGIGGKMIAGAVRGAPAGDAADDHGGARQRLVLAVATSLDALAAGVTLDVLGAPPAVALVLIGVVTVVLAAAGYAAGRRLGSRAASRHLELAGGVVIVAIGVKILVEHLA